MLNLNLLVITLVSFMDYVPYLLMAMYIPVIVISLIVDIYEITEACVLEYLTPQILEFKLACLCVYGVGGFNISDATTIYSIEYCDPNIIYHLDSKESKYYVLYSDEDINALNRESRRYSNKNMNIIDTIGCKRFERNWKSHRNNQYKIVSK